jgi:8-oxo-dGTP pyrophosphatase MutT (NUDIX family)
MHRKNLRERLERYHPTDEKEIFCRANMLKFLDAHGDCFERSSAVGHFCGSCWLENFDGTKFLLTLHGKYRQWTPLGGHADGDPDMPGVALKEAREESGLEHLELMSDEIFDIGIYPSPERDGNSAHFHYSVTFLLRAFDPSENIKISDESLDLKWFEEYPVDDAEEFEMTRQFLKWKKLRQAERVTPEQSF